jgi:hypothetical protein
MISEFTTRRGIHTYEIVMKSPSAYEFIACEIATCV